MTDSEKSRILLVDDDKSLLVTLRDFLDFEGYDVTTAASGEDGLECLEEVSPDLIVLDMSMPGMGGIGFLEKISKAGRPAYPVLVLTARAQMAEFFGTLDVEGFVTKPCDPNDLLMEISRIIFLTRGKAPHRRGTTEPVVHRSILLGENDELVGETLRALLAEEKFIVHSVTRGPDILEKAILARPDVLVINAALAAEEDGAVARMLCEMPNTRQRPLVIYGVSGEISLPKTVTRNPSVRCLVEARPSVVLAAIHEALIEEPRTGATDHALSQV